MEKVIIDEKLIDEILERGVEQVFPDKESFKKKLLSGERIRLYCGYDPSAPALHIGNAATLNKLSQFQKLGHEVIFLVGDFTGMIGDPTDKEATRKKLTREEVLKNAEDYQKQASGYLQFGGANPAKIMYNSEWSDKLTFRDVIEIASNFTVGQMIQRDMFQKRMESEKPIYLHEFLYPLAQGYDSVAMDVDAEIGGNDQMFNMLAGRTLQKNINNKEKFVLTLKLLADETGKKMGKTEGNAVFLNQTPEDMFGAVMSWTDGIIAVGFEMVTDVSTDEIGEIKKALQDEKNNPRDFKIELAYEMVKISHSEKAAKEARENFEKVFSRKELPDEIKKFDIGNGLESVRLVDFMVLSGLAKSNGDARRKIEQGGVSINGKKETDKNLILYKNKDGDAVIKAGKLFFARVGFGKK